MIKRLKRIFPSLVIGRVNLDEQSADYEWFISGENEVIGIHKDDLTNKNAAILSTFLQRLNIKVPVPTEEEVKWKELINNPEALTSIKMKSSFRFVFFSINNLQIEPWSFNEAIQEIFAQQVPIIWNNEREGIIIEKLSITNETISYQQIIDILMSDLYVKIKFFIGPFQENLNQVHDTYKQLANAAKIAFTHSKKTVTTYIDSIPYLLIDEIGPDYRSTISSMILKDMLGDEEMLKTIEVLFECNLNVTVAAKKMYMHRNSLQYRIDKFTEQTGINIQQFDQALTVYLAILAKRRAE